MLVPLSLVKTGGIQAYVHFKQNSEKHKSTPLTNYMGLRTVVAYTPSEAGRFMKNDRLDDPWGPWKIAKLRTFHERKFLFAIAALGFATLLWFAVRGAEPWVACALSAMMIAVGVELTCYYYSFLIVVALLYDKRKEAGAMLLAVTASTSFIDWAPTRFLPETGIWRWLKMPTWLDEQYMWMGGDDADRVRLDHVPIRLRARGAVGRRRRAEGAARCGRRRARARRGGCDGEIRVRFSVGAASAKWAKSGSKQRGPGGKRKDRAKK